VSTTAQLRTAFFEEHLRDLNRLVFAAEALEVPDVPEVPNWERESPDNLECLGEETRTPEELQAIGLQWQAFACKLHDILTEVGVTDFPEVVADLHAKAKAAREALIKLDAYDPPVPGSP
jgi:hypothetical protein